MTGWNGQASTGHRPPGHDPADGPALPAGPDYVDLDLGAALVLALAGVAAGPWRVLPTFLGETHFAFLGYAKNFRQTPAKRQMDYLRQVAGSREGAKELKLFNLSDYLSNRFTQLSKSDLRGECRRSRAKS